MSTDSDAACADLESLLRKVGARAEPPAALVSEVRAAVETEWQALVQTRRHQARVRWAVAATVLVAATLGVVARQTWVTAVPDTVAAITRVDGTATGARAQSLESLVLRRGAPISVGETIHTTTDAHVAVALASGLSLRLDDNTTVKWVAPDRVQLIAGALYLDSPPSAHAAAFDVEALGTSIRHLGTQYQVRVQTPIVQVGVREGRVAVTNSAGTSTGQAGESLAIAGDGTITRKVLSPWDGEWQWVTQAAPPFAIAGQPLAAFLEWVARETGRQLIYTSPAAEEIAGKVRMQGTIEGLDMGTALQAVLATTKLHAESEAQTLKITLQQ